MKQTPTCKSTLISLVTKKGALAAAAPHLLVGVHKVGAVSGGRTPSAALPTLQLQIGLEKKLRIIGTWTNGNFG